ncbi:hypothetical protein LB524_13685 [Mesorhizobium sp. ESP6-5]|uniref:hypothetical protein n=1 Tax=unclassified Mesorhizobium TaxID=325217 RepID=UPI00112D867F|nr:MULTISPECIES: hypothetical protein [unclassified Mesorhizobium]MBZ9756343.1 hypothetical protein [Mesorhizobium sp. ESP6-5]TPK73166.1 hypothetical protein FJ527_22445 [Mesorhizobium sp. B2-4-18]
MSAIAFDRVGLETETNRPAPVSNPRSREEEFRAALDHYMADYVARQKRCAEARDAASQRDRA